MTIRVSTPDGGIAEFPDGTSPDVMRTALRAKFGGGPAKSVARYIDDAVRSVASGITFGYADTIAAKLDELTGRGGTYEENLKAQRARSAEAPAAIRIPGEIVGGVAGAVALSPVAGAAGTVTGLSRLPATAKVIGAGAAAGGLTASGEAEPGKRLEAVPEGALTGAVLGSVAAGAGRLIGLLRSPAERARALILRALDRDEISPQQAAQKAIELQAQGRQATLADVGGENVRGQVERLSNTPGAGRTTVIPFLTERQQGQLARISNDLSELSGSSRSALDAVDETITARTQASVPAYSSAYQAGDRPIWSDELERLSAVPEVQRAMRGAVAGWQRSQIAAGYGAMNPGAMVDRGGILKFLNGKVPAFPNLQFWDYTKNVLDSMIQNEIKDGVMSRKGRDLTIIVQKMREQLDRDVPQYAAARESWAGPTSYLNAIKLGRGILSGRKSADEMHKEFNALSAADKQGYREGAVSSIVARMERDPSKLADLTKFLRSPGMRKAVAGMMPDAQSAQAWLKRLDIETRSSELVGQGLKGSQTARRLAEAEDAKDIVGDLVLGAVKGAVSPKSMMAKILVTGYGRARDTLRSRTDKELANLLTMPARNIPQSVDTPLRRRLGQSTLAPSLGSIGATSAAIEQ